MPMHDNLTCLSAGNGKLEAIDNVVKTTFKSLQQVVTRCSFLFYCVFKETPKLLFKKTVHTFHFLFFFRLFTVLRKLPLALYDLLLGTTLLVRSFFGYFCILFIHNRFFPLYNTKPTTHDASWEGGNH